MTTTWVLIYFGIGIILDLILSVLYVLTKEGKYESRIIGDLGIDDSMDLGLAILVTTFVWPLEISILIFIGLIFLIIFGFNYIAEGLTWLIKKVLK